MNRTSIVALSIVVVIVAAAVISYAYIYSSSGTLQVLATDPPADWGVATQIYLNYSVIEVHRADADNSSGWVAVTDGNGMLNLTQFVDVNQTIGSKNLQPGTYNLIRFSINQATVTVNDVNYTATVPSGTLQIAITQGGVIVKAGQTSKLLIELNTKVEGSTDNLKIVPDIRATPI